MLSHKVSIIFILHGWGLSKNKYEGLKSVLTSHGYNVFIPDLPGFGKEPLVKKSMNLDDYVEFVDDLVKENNIKKLILVGHSFGGRIAAKLSVTNPELVEKLILTGAPLIKQRLSFKKKMLVFAAKIVKKSLKGFYGEMRMRRILYFLLGEWDYYKAPADIKQTFKAIISEDLSAILPQISVPTLVLWGKKDTVVPASIGKEIANRIPHAMYQEISDATHRLPYENPEIFTDAVMKFLDRV